MTTTNISLPEDIQAFMETQMSLDGCASVSEFLCVLLRDEQRRRARRELEGKFQEAIQSGPAEPLTREDWKSLEDQVWDRHRHEQSQP